MSLSLAGLTPLQRANLENIVAVRELCIASLGEAAWTYSIDAEQIAFYAKLSDSEIFTLVADLDVALFVPRHSEKQLRAILAQPPKWRGVYAAVLEQDARTLDIGDTRFGGEVCGA
jgi:hypothetical protein